MTEHNWTSFSLQSAARTWLMDPAIQPGYAEAIKKLDRQIELGGRSWREPLEWELNPLLPRISAALFGGPGFVLISLGSTLCSDTLRCLTLHLGCSFGENVTATASGDDRPLFRLGVAKDATAGQKYIGNGLKSRAIGLHTDGSGAIDRTVNVIGLLCLTQARFGGQSRLAHSGLAFSLLSSSAREILTEPMPRISPYRITGTDSKARVQAVYGTPMECGGLEFSYHPDRVRDGLRLSSPHRFAESEQAFHELDALLSANALEINLMRGDLLLINNRVIAHDRRRFHNGLRPRVLERFWAGSFSVAPERIVKGIWT